MVSRGSCLLAMRSDLFVHCTPFQEGRRTTKGNVSSRGRREVYPCTFTYSRRKTNITKKEKKEKNSSMLIGGGRRRGKTVQHHKVEVKRKWWVLAQPPLFPARKRKVVIWVETTIIDHPTRRITRGAGIVKDWENKRDHGCIPETFT